MTNDTDYEDADTETPPTVGALSAYPITSTPIAKRYATRILDQGLNVPDQTPDLLKDLSKNAEAAREVLRAAQQRLLARKSNRAAEQLLAQSQAFTRPTNNFAETMGNVAGATLAQNNDFNKREDDRDSQRLKLEMGMTGVDDDLLKNKLALLKLQSANRSGLMSSALKILAAADGLPKKGSGMSAYGKIAADEGFEPGTPQFNQRVSQLRDQDYRVKTATAGIDAPEGGSGIGEDSGEDAFSRLGVPKAPIDPYVGLSTKAKMAVMQSERAKATKTLGALTESVPQAEAAIQDLDRFIELNKNHPSGGSQGDIPVIGGIASWATGFGKDAKEMDAITARISRQMRVPGEGQTSDFDAKQFLKGTIGRDKPYETNKNIVLGMKAQKQLQIDRAEFFNNYYLANGHLSGAQTEWMKYLDKNPIFDPKALAGSFKLNKTRKSYREFFNQGKEDPTQGGEYPYADEEPKSNFADGGEVDSDDSDILRSMLQGATFGMGDEGLAAMQKGPYDSNLKSERAKLLKSQSDAPLVSELGSAAGMTGTLLALGKLVAKSKGMSDAALRLVPHRELIKLALTGAAAGGLTGFGSGEADNRLPSALSTAGLGTGLSVLGGLAAKYGISGAEGLVDRLRGDPITGAEKRLVNTLGEDTGGVTGAFQDLPGLRRAGVTPTLLDTGGPKVRALGEAAATRRGPESDALVDQMATRAADTRNRVGDKINKALKPDEYFGKMEDLQKELSKNAQPMYEAAYKAFPSISSPTLMGILSTPDGQRALRMGMRLAGNRQMGITPEGLQTQELTPLQQMEKSAKEAGLFESEDPTPEQRLKEAEWLKNYKATQALGDQPAEKVAPGLPLEFYDYVKRGFDQLVNDAENNGRGTTLSHSIRGLRNRLRSELDNATSDSKGTSPYAAARAQYAGDLEILDALKSGREDFNTMTPEEIRKKVADMSFAEKDAYRSGVAQHLFEKINGPTSDINAARRIIGSPSTTEKLRPLFETPAQFNLFKTALDKEMEMFDKSKSLVSRAESSRRTAAGQGESLLEKIDPSMHSTPWGFTPTTWALNLLRQVPTMSNDTAQGISKALRTTDPSELKTLSQRLEKVSNKLKGRSRRAGKAGVIGAAITGALAAPAPEGKNLEEDEADAE